MSDRANLVRVLTSATGTGTMTLGAAYSQLFMTSAEANMVDGRTYTYLLVDGNNWELGKGVYTASGTTLSRVTVLASRISSTLGTTKITLSGTAQVRIIESADDMGALRGTRAVTGTSDTLAQTDLGRAVTYSNASAIAVSLAQAGASSSFLDGWATWVQNLGAGAVTITPATSTINGAATLVLAQNLGAFIWSDGTNYHAYYVPITKPLLAANNLSEVVAATALGNLNGVSYGASQSLTTTQKKQSQSNILVAPTATTLLSGSGTYTTPTGCTRIRVRMVGGGGGGGGSQAGGGSSGGAGGNTTFGTSLLVANGGNGGSNTAGVGGNSGGTASLGTGPIGIALSGGTGGGSTNNTGYLGYPWGGMGASSPFGGAGGAGPANTTAVAAVANTGSGGGGAAGSSAGGMNAGAGGGAGGFVDAIISSPSATYSYAVGAGGSAGTAGTSGFNGGAGGSGAIYIEEYYGS